MIGVFDSGVGGFNSLIHLRRLLPFADILYLADRENAPYGIKTRDELISLVEKGIDRLLDRGACKILLACCTASTVWDALSPRQRDASVPIIQYVERALFEMDKRVMVIATERTVSDGAFGRVINRKNPNLNVIEIPMQGLVLAVENGARMGNLREATRVEIEKIRKIALEICPDALVLGCTHFSSVADLIRDALPSVRIINPAQLGAVAMAEDLVLTGSYIREGGKLIYM